MIPAVELSKFYEQHKLNSIHLHFTMVEVDIYQTEQIKLELQVCLHTRKCILGQLALFKGQQVHLFWIHTNRLTSASR